MKKCTMRRALGDPKLLGTILPGDSWLGWRALLIASMGESLTDEERAAFAKLTGRPHEPGQRVEELWVISGRRGGKSRSAATLAVYLAALCDHTSRLSVGEKPVVLFLAQNQRQAAIAFGYCVGIFDAVPMLSRLVVNRTADTLSLSNNVDLEVRPASFRSLRGVTAVGAICDEVCYWRLDTSLNPDAEILNAVRPALATTGGPLVVISSPYSKRGEVFNTYREHYGPSGDPAILVAKGASRDFNPSLPQATVDRALKRDHAKASAEYLGEFRTDLENFVDFETVQACVGEHLELPRGGFQYRAFCDAAGGSGGDSFTLAIGHRESDDRVFIDAIRETRPPFSPMQVIDDYAALLKSYGIARVSGDRFSGGFASEQFHRRGISYQPTTMFKSDLYRDLLPLLNSGRIVLPRSDRLINQICSLERKIGRSGKDSISHPEREHDDVANAVAGVANLLVGGQGGLSPHLVDRCFTDEVQPIFKDWEGPSQWLH